LCCRETQVETWTSKKVVAVAPTDTIKE
jgi:hypothetical protein